MVASDQSREAPYGKPNLGVVQGWPPFTPTSFEHGIHSDDVPFSRRRRWPRGRFFKRRPNPQDRVGIGNIGVAASIGGGKPDNPSNTSLGPPFERESRRSTFGSTVCDHQSEGVLAPRAPAFGRPAFRALRRSFDMVHTHIAHGSSLMLGVGAADIL